MYSTLRRATSPSHDLSEEKRPRSPVEDHETPPGWGVQRKAQYTGRQLPPSSSESSGVQWSGKKRAPSESNIKKPKKKKPRGDKTRRKSDGKHVLRWPSERYEAAEEKLVEILQKMGAERGNPIPRRALKEEARKHIGDIGLLNHLFKNMVGKVVADGSKRLRRWTNEDDIMEYWLEPADLAEIRSKIGVSDPYWVPPPGWKEASDLSEEIAAVKRDYQRLLQWKIRMEEGMAGMSNSLQALKGEVGLMKEEKNKKPRFASGACH